MKVKVIVITFEPLRADVLLLAKEQMSFPYYLDEQRKLYRDYGLFKAGFWNLWGPRTWLIYLRLLLKGRKILKSQSDIQQRGGDVLIDPGGIIRFHYISNGPADRPDPELICRLVGSNSSKERKSGIA